MKLSALSYVAIDTETAFRTKEDSPDGQEYNELLEFGLVNSYPWEGVNDIEAKCSPSIRPTPQEPIVGDDSFAWGLCKPSMRITPECAATHDIRNQDVEGFPDARALMPEIARRIQDKVVLIHNAGFDWPLLQRHADAMGLSLKPLVVLDTLPVFQAIFTERRQHKLTVLKHALDLPQLSAHRALQDSGVLAMVFNAAVCRFVMEGGQDDLRAFLGLVIHNNERAAQPFETVTFGKYKNVPLDQVPLDYLQWWFRGRKIDPNKEPFYQADFSFAYELKRRCPSFNLTESYIEDLRKACIKPLPWPHRL